MGKRKRENTLECIMQAADHITRQSRINACQHRATPYLVLLAAEQPVLKIERKNNVYRVYNGFGDLLTMVNKRCMLMDVVRDVLPPVPVHQVAFVGCPGRWKEALL